MVELSAVFFEVLLVGIATTLFYSYIKFSKMNPEIRKARLYIMSQRIQRFLLAFTLGFLAITVVFAISFSGVALPGAITVGAVFFWIGAIFYGSLEILFIVRPRTPRRASVGPPERGSEGKVP